MTVLDTLTKDLLDTAQDTTARDPARVAVTTELFPSDLHEATLLVVDDEELNIRLLRTHLRRKGFKNVLGCVDSTLAFEMVAKTRPDLVILDVVMPGKDGIEVLEEIRSRDDFASTPVFMLTASEDPAQKAVALEKGATDFLSKPVDTAELLARVRNAIAMKTHFNLLRNQADVLESLVCARTEEVKASRTELVYCLARAVECRDATTGKHVVRVGRYVGLIAKRLGVERSLAELYELAAPLHDIGKIGIPDEILLKPGRLTARETEIMRRHCVKGQQTFVDLPPRTWLEIQKGDAEEPPGDSPPISRVLAVAANIALTHHEWWNGTGYPLGLHGDEIPLEGRITALADVFDALCTARPYKRAFPPKDSFDMMKRHRGSHFDPDAFDSFESCFDQVLEIRGAYRDADQETAHSSKL